MSSSVIDEKVSRIFSYEIQRIVDEIAWVDRRLAELGDDDESRAERILLEALRRHLINDLRELGGFSGDPYMYVEPVGDEAREARDFAVAFS